MHEILLTFRIRASLSGIEQTAQFGVARIILILTDLKFSAKQVTTCSKPLLGFGARWFLPTASS